MLPSPGAVVRLAQPLAATAGGELVLYARMCSAITACHQVDEVLDIHDKARALEVYALQARNIEAERKACEVRMRAERRLGELLKELARAQGGNRRSESVSRDGTLISQSPYAEALTNNHIPAHRYQKLAEVPQAEFEHALADPKIRPSTNRIIAAPRARMHQAQSGPARRNKAKEQFEELQQQPERGESMLAYYLRTALQIISTQASLTAEENELLDELDRVRPWHHGLLLRED
jgi:hypothetical protein